MVVEVLYFASLRDRTGCDRESVELEADADVATLWRLLRHRHPELAALGYRPMVACDRVYADWARKLSGVGEVAFLPPVSGG